jgi:phage-related protein
LKDVATTAIDWFKGINWKQAGIDVINFVKGGLDMLINTIPTKLKSIATTAIERFKASGWITAGYQTITKIVAGIVEKITAIPNKLKQIGRDAIEGIKNLNWLQIGKDIVNGIIDGIGQVAQDLVDAAVNAAKSAWNAVTGFLGINSPSRLWRDTVGRGMAEGMAVGFDKWMNLSDYIKEIQDITNASAHSAQLAASTALPTTTGSYTPAAGPAEASDHFAATVLEGTRQIAAAVEAGISQMKMVANNRETARFVAELGFARA